MSLLRAAAVRPKQALLAMLPRRYSTSHEEHHDHDHHEDNTVYPKENFFNKVWLGWTVAGLVTMGWYNYAPGSGEGTYLTKAISHYITPHQVWERINLKHLTMSAEGQVDALTVGSAKRPPVHRYRYPQSFEQHSVHLLPVGHQADLSGLVVKSDRQ